MDHVNNKREVLDGTKQLLFQRMPATSSCLLLRRDDPMDKTFRSLSLFSLGRIPTLRYSEKHMFELNLEISFKDICNEDVTHHSAQKHITELLDSDSIEENRINFRDGYHQDRNPNPVAL